MWEAEAGLWVHHCCDILGWAQAAFSPEKVTEGVIERNPEMWKRTHARVCTKQNRGGGRREELNVRSSDHPLAPSGDSWAEASQHSWWGGGVFRGQGASVSGIWRDWSCQEWSVRLGSGQPRRDGSLQTAWGSDPRPTGHLTPGVSSLLCVVLASGSSPPRSQVLSMPAVGGAARGLVQVPPQFRKPCVTGALDLVSPGPPSGSSGELARLESWPTFLVHPG